MKTYYVDTKWFGGRESFAPEDNPVPVVTLSDLEAVASQFVKDCYNPCPCCCEQLTALLAACRRGKP